jgi:hypothetical protein
MPHLDGVATRGSPLDQPEKDECKGSDGRRVKSLDVDESQREEINPTMRGSYRFGVLVQLSLFLYVLNLS